MAQALISRNPDKYITFVYVLTDVCRMTVIDVFEDYDAATEAGEAWTKNFRLVHPEDYGKRRFKVKEFIIKG